MQRFAIVGLMLVGCASPAWCDDVCDKGTAWQSYVKIVDVEPSYMPGKLTFAVEPYPKEQCPNSAYLTWHGDPVSPDDPADLRSNNEAALYVLTEALLSGNRVHLTVNKCNACYAHLVAK